jgi:hypothetical protein
MHLVEILLPVRDPEGRPFERAIYDRLARELIERFGGLTAHSRAPAAGLWKEDSGATQRDDIVVYEVMVEALDPAWWAGLRRELETRLRQDEIVIRSHEIRRL